jgi:uncharacterized surface protein with fasciclin (FAS1) repeats
MKISIIAVLLTTALFISGCSDAYFTDGGAPVDQTGVLNLTTMKYLESEPAKFDTLVILIKLAGLEAEVNKSGNTFLAPQNYSIHNYLKLMYPDQDKWPALKDLSAAEKKDITQILKNYIIPDKKIERNGLSSTYSYATTSGGKKSRFNLIKEDYLGNVNMGAAYVVFALDISEDGSTVERYQSVQVVTSGLQSTNGIVHVLDPNSHIFGFK